MRFNYVREHDVYKIVDTQQGYRLHVAECYCPDLAESIVKMLNENPKLHQTKGY